MTSLPSWFTEEDGEILHVLSHYRIALTPLGIRTNLGHHPDNHPDGILTDLSLSTIKQRMEKLCSEGFLERVPNSEDCYRITDAGEYIFTRGNSIPAQETPEPPFVEEEGDLLYPTTDAVIAFHQEIISEDVNADPGIKKKGQIDTPMYIIRRIEEGLHHTAFELMRLLAANHGFVDGNKRTALNTTATFYLLNGCYFDYGEDIKAILKLLAVDENMVNKQAVIEKFQDVSVPIDEIEDSDLREEARTHVENLREEWA